jgi:hypothetical protein
MLPPQGCNVAGNFSPRPDLSSAYPPTGLLIVSGHPSSHNPVTVYSSGLGEPIPVLRCQLQLVREALRCLLGGADGYATPGPVGVPCGRTRFCPDAVAAPRPRSALTQLREIPRCPLPTRLVAAALLPRFCGCRSVCPGEVTPATHEHRPGCQRRAPPVGPVSIPGETTVPTHYRFGVRAVCLDFLTFPGGPKHRIAESETQKGI